MHELHKTCLGKCWWKLDRGKTSFSSSVLTIADALLAKTRHLITHSQQDNKPLGLRPECWTQLAKRPVTCPAVLNMWVFGCFLIIYLIYRQIIRTDIY